MFEDEELQSMMLGAAPEGELSDDFTFLPQNDNGYIGTIEKIKFNSGVSEKGNRWVQMACQVVVDDEKLQKELGPIGCRARYSCFLDFDFEKKVLKGGPNQNVELGRLYTAAGLKKNAKPEQLDGRQIRFWHAIEEYKGRKSAVVERIGKAS